MRVGAQERDIQGVHSNPAFPGRYFIDCFIHS